MGIKELLDKYDNSNLRPFDELDIEKSLKELTPEESTSVDFNLSFEIIAFEFSEKNSNSKKRTNCFYEPKYTVSNKEGFFIEHPTSKDITKEIIEYWTNRTYSSKHPILTARYSGLVLDFQFNILNIKPNHDITKIHIQALIDTSKLDFNSHESYIFKKIERALEISIQINDSILIESSKLTLLKFEKENSIDNKPNTWGFCFDLLIGNKKSNLSQNEENAIIYEL